MHIPCITFSCWASAEGHSPSLLMDTLVLELLHLQGRGAAPWRCHLGFSSAVRSCGQAQGFSHPCFSASVCRVKAVGSLGVARQSGQASGRRKAELANLFLGASVSHAKDCLNCTNPRCLQSNLVYKSRHFKQVPGQLFYVSHLLNRALWVREVGFETSAHVLPPHPGILEASCKEAGGFLGTIQIHL